MDTDSLYLALSEENLEDVFFPKNETNGTGYILKIALITLLRMQQNFFFLRTCCNANKKHDKREPGLFKEEFRLQKVCACVAKPIGATIERVTSTNSVARDSLKEL